jgi:hypothetical protein
VVNLSKQSNHWPKRSVRMETLPVRFKDRTRGEDVVIRHSSGIPTLSARSADERLVLVQVRQAFLQVHRPSVRMGPEPDVVYLSIGIHGQKRNVQYRVLAYLDDFLIRPVKAGRVSSIRDCQKAT